MRRQEPGPVRTAVCFPHALGLARTGFVLIKVAVATETTAIVARRLSERQRFRRNTGVAWLLEKDFVLCARVLCFM